jgi:flagellar assembly protein FliH
MSDGPVGFGAQDGARSVDTSALGDYMAGLRGGFSATGFNQPAGGPVHFSPAPGPKHFRPADPDHNPTEGWNPFEAAGEPPVEAVEPVLDAIDSARAEGFAAGLEAAQRVAASGAAEHAGAIDRLIAALESMGGFDREALAGRLRQTVLYLVTRMVGEIGVAPDLLVQRIEAAVKLLADSSEPALMRLNPADLALVDGRVPDRVFAIADKAIERGALVIETRTTVIEDGPSGWLNQLAAAIDRTALPDQS